MTSRLDVKRARRRARVAVRLHEPVRAPAPGWLDRVPPALLLLGVIGVSALGHGALMEGLARLRPPRARLPPAPRVTITVVDPPAPPPAPPPVEAPSPAPAEPLPVVRHKKLTPPRRDLTPPPPRLAPPPPTEEALTDTPPVVIAGAALSATTSTGTIAVGVGNTMRGRAADVARADARPYRAAEYAESYALTEEPVFLDNVSLAKLRSFYPEDARRTRREGSVRVKLLVDHDGSVARVTVLEDPGHGFGAAATKVGRLYRFKPGRVNGRPVATEILFTIHFALD